MSNDVAYFDIGDMLPIAVTLVVVGIAIAFGLNVVADIQDDFITNTAGCNATTTVGCQAEYNATVDTISGISKLSGKLPIIGLVVVAAIIIGILVRFFLNKATA